MKQIVTCICFADRFVPFDYLHILFSTERTFQYQIRLNISEMVCILFFTCGFHKFETNIPTDCNELKFEFVLHSRSHMFNIIDSCRLTDIAIANKFIQCNAICLHMMVNINAMVGQIKRKTSGLSNQCLFGSFFA